LYRLTSLLQPKSQSIRIKEKPYIRVNTRELNGVPATKCLPYIHLANGLCYTNLAYSEKICVLHAVNM